MRLSVLLSLSLAFNSASCWLMKARIPVGYRRLARPPLFVEVTGTGRGRTTEIVRASLPRSLSRRYQRCNAVDCIRPQYFAPQSVRHSPRRERTQRPLASWLDKLRPYDSDLHASSEITRRNRYRSEFRPGIPCVSMSIAQACRLPAALSHGQRQALRPCSEKRRSEILGRPLIRCGCEIGRPQHGRCPHNASRRPWKLHVVLAFADEDTALRFERCPEVRLGPRLREASLRTVRRAGPLDRCRWPAPGLLRPAADARSSRTPWSVYL